MRFELIEAGEDPLTTAHELRALVPRPDEVRDTVAEIVADVRARGDAAIHEYTQKFDTPDPRPLIVEPQELERAAEALDPAVRAGLELAIENVQGVAAGENRQTAIHFGGHLVTVAEKPVHRAAVYVPGGRAPYPSTVVMGVVPARVAGVHQITVCSPAPVADVVLAACHLSGAQRVYRMGGAQAIAALAYGTESVPRQDVIVGPGNLYVQEAKRQVSADVGIEGFAGPSDLLVIADAEADSELIALDLIAQAEHGPGTLVVAISTDRNLLEAIAARLQTAPETGASAVGVLAGPPGQALALAEEFAPEHLQLMGPDAESLADEVTRAGCVFVGANAGTAFGDYIAGSNHILPTNGAARFASALSPAHFRRTFAQVRIGDPAPLAQAAAPLARAEGFEYHARSMEARIRQNGAK
jgi:histidinol dehydrogenase